MPVHDVDILVVGAGPAGLLTASYLAPKFRVGLIERGEIGRTTKYWVTTESRLRRHGLSDCVLAKPPAMIVGTFLGGQVSATGDLVVVDDARLLNTLVERCQLGSVILEGGCQLLNVAWKADRVFAGTTTGTYSTRLLIDATGSRSPIAETFELHKLYGFMSVHGSHIRNIRLNTSDVILAYANELGNPSVMIEVVPTSTESAYCTVFVYAKQLMSTALLASTFKRQCAHNPFFELTAHSEHAAGKTGAIAIGKRRRRSLPGLISIGEADLIQPPLLGSAFNELLEYCSPICEHITRLLATHDSIPLRCNWRYPLIKRFQDHAQLTLARVLLRGNVETFDRVLRSMNRLPPGAVYRFCSNELRLSELLISIPRVLLLTAFAGGVVRTKGG